MPSYIDAFILFGLPPVESCAGEKGITPTSQGGSIMIVKSIFILAFIAALWVLGVIHLEDLPLGSQEFQVCGSTVLLYLIWSAAEANRRTGQGGLPYLVFYVVLLVSAVDSFLLQLTTVTLPWSVRWAGVLLFAAGSFCRLAAFRRNRSDLLRFGRYLQLAGLPVALGSIVGLAVAAAAGIPGSIHEEIEPLHENEEMDT